MRITKVLFITLAAFLSLNACKKEEEKKEPTKTDHLQNGKWKLASANAAGGVFDLMTSLKDCQKDNFYTFNTDKTITVDEGATKCSASASQITTEGNWALLNNDAQMSISGEKITAGFGNLTGDVVTISATTLQLKKDTVVSGFPTTAIITFSNVK